MAPDQPDYVEILKQPFRNRAAKLFTVLVCQALVCFLELLVRDDLVIDLGHNVLRPAVAADAPENKDQGNNEDGALNKGGLGFSPQ